MTKITRYSIEYYDGMKAQIARFSSYDDAMTFARAHGQRFSSQVNHSSGVIGQFHNGKASQEFAHLDNAAAG
jgi:hypothetical protein